MSKNPRPLNTPHKRYRKQINETKWWVNEYLGVARGPCDLGWHSVSLSIPKHNNDSTIKHNQKESKSLLIVMSLDKTEYYSHTLNIFEKALLLLPTTLHMQNDWSQTHFWNISWKPSLHGASDPFSSSSFPQFLLVYCLLVYHVAPVGLSDIIPCCSPLSFLRSCSRKESKGPTPKAKLTSFHKARARLKKLQINLFHPLYTLMYMYFF